MKFNHWRTRLIVAIDSQVSHERLWFLAAWQECEGGTARFNPLNTTYKLQGSTDYNSAGVQHYEDELQGLAATILTLRLSYYRDLMEALRDDRLSARQILARSEKAIRIWGTNPLCIKTTLG